MSELMFPANYEEFTQTQKAEFLKVKAFKESGRKLAGTFCSFTPLEVLDAAGIASVKLFGADSGVIPAAETVLPRYLCPLVKSTYGLAQTESCPYSHWADILIGETTCDGRKKMYDFLGQKKNMYILQVPQGADLPYARKLWRKEVRYFIEYISKEFDVAITDDMLREAAVKRNELRKARMELMELQKAQPAAVSGVTLHAFLEKLDTCMDIDEALAEIRQFIAGAKDQIPGSAKRLLITGCPMGGVVDKVVRAVERNGGSVVCFETCTGMKAARCLVDTGREDIVDAIADAYLDVGCAVMAPNPRRMENLPELIKEFRVDGVIDVTLQACTCYSIETRAVRKLCEAHNIPCMSLETDYSQTDSGQLETRIAAFGEML
ncbi:MAG: 2-hydroxyacyl-CoA dehydratase [Oscillospiraceae bacterium]|nr:2-hydroxyacyl-CoA dehydratase [Oscillospiraceae bacterium]